MAAKRLIGLVCALVIMSGHSAGQASRKQLKPQPNLPIDCANYAQPCTGTECVSQQASFYCAATGDTFICENDTQNYVGGNTVCCTGKNPCYSCPYNGKTIPYYSYFGVTSRTCYVNP